jgi:hypothetical protein
MSYQNYEGFPPQPTEDGNGQAVPGAPVQHQMQPIESTGGQFAPPANNVGSPQTESVPGGDSKTTLW